MRTSNLSLAFTIQSFIHLCFANQIIMQLPEDGKSKAGSAALNTPKIAIIGAGITGTSSAHYLHQLTRLRQPLDITVFEAGDQVGGRVRSAYVHDEPAFDVEVGSATFTEDDWCLKDAMQEVGLKSVVRLRSAYHTAVWDGNEMLVSYRESDKPLSNAAWRSPQWLWRYGLSLFKVYGMIKQTAEDFSSFAVFHPFLNLSKKLQESFASQEVLPSAASVFDSSRINTKLVDEIIRAESRYRYARDLDQVNLLSSLLALRSTADVGIYQGNQRLPNRMLKIAGAHVHLNHRVSRITAGDQRQWKIHSVYSDDQAEAQPLMFEAEFDIIILTAPFASNAIDIDLPMSMPISATEVRPYIERHVTLFSTLHHLSPKYFNQPNDTIIPENIFTAPSQPTSEENNDIFSITVSDRVPPPDTIDEEDELEYVYKIISSKPIPDDEIARLLGYNIDSSNITKQEEQTLYDLGVTWLHRQEWPHAYPQFDPKQPILDNIEIAPDLYYTAASEEVLSTMEMGCRMGKNVAKHLYHSKWLGETYP